MANIVITTTGNSIIVTFNDYSSVVGSIKRSQLKSDITEIELDSDHVQVAMRDSHNIKTWYLTYDSSYSGNQYFIVDSISGVAPSSESDLFDKLTALRG